jgi:Putative MetA-pathway of phenol degradation
MERRSAKMCGWQRLRYIALAIMLSGTLSIAAQSEARDLTDALVKGYVGLAPAFSGGSFCPCAFAQSLASALSTATSQTITQDAPIASVAPAFSYRYNPTLSIFERSAGMLGPMFAERSLTIGKGKFNFEIGYAYVGFDDINGTNLDKLRTGPGVLLTNQTADAAQLRTSLDVQTHVFAPTFRYGITDRLDVGLIIPILNTSLRIRNTTVMVANQVTPNLDLSDSTKVQNNLGNLRFVSTEPSLVRQPVRSAESATGVGDIILRSKYNFWLDEGGVAAFGLNLLLPSGAEDNLQGTGETHITPLLMGSQVMYNRLEPHVNLGVDFNADDVDRSSFVYVAGTTLQVWRPLALVVDIMGRSEFGRLQVANKKLAADGLLLDKPVNQCTAVLPCSGQSSKVFIFPEKFTQRNDIVSFAFGLRYALGESGSIYFGGVVPLNDDGFRSNFIPSGGVEYTF